MRKLAEHPRCPPRLDRLFAMPIYFVTFNTYRRRPILTTPPVHAAFVGFAGRALTEHNVSVGRYVIMPDHIHLFVAGDQHFDLAKWIKALKQTLSKQLSHSPSERVWQESFFDHVLRSDESYEQKWEYVRANPVRAGLVAETEAWPFAGEIGVIDRA